MERPAENALESGGGRERAGKQAGADTWRSLS